MIAKMKPSLRRGLPVVAVLAMSGCHPAGSDDVEQRAIARWNYLIAHQADKAYDYLTPGARAMQTREAYASSMNNRPVRWTEAKFKDKECDADRCKLRIDVTYSLRMPGTGISGTPVNSTSTQSETWVHVKGDWYYLPN